MKRLIIPLILFLFLVLEGVALELLPVSLVKGELVIVPHWVLGILLFLAIFYDRENTYYSILYGLLFGLLIDIVYTGVLGVYMFTYGLVTYGTHGLTKMFHANIFTALLLGMAGLLLAELSINTIFSVVGIAEMPWREYLLFRMVPTVIANLLFMIIVYPFLGKRFVNWGEEHLARDTAF
ncbi:rod shape-determining protein MreD [Virgibacillus kekensis]|uniref:Rod shape-determining protein MreD n=1 Tax=Virgibacillus kekensis TaxID=202261 RepID=A0ABV9DLC1_9BACI